MLVLSLRGWAEAGSDFDGQELVPVDVTGGGTGDGGGGVHLDGDWGGFDEVRRGGDAVGVLQGGSGEILGGGGRDWRSVHVCGDGEPADGGGGGIGERHGADFQFEVQGEQPDDSVGVGRDVDVFGGGVVGDGDGVLGVEPYGAAGAEGVGLEQDVQRIRTDGDGVDGGAGDGDGGFDDASELLHVHVAGGDFGCGVLGDGGKRGRHGDSRRVLHDRREMRDSEDRDRGASDRGRGRDDERGEPDFEVGRDGGVTVGDRGEPDDGGEPGGGEQLHASDGEDDQREGRGGGRDGIGAVFQVGGRNERVVDLRRLPHVGEADGVSGGTWRQWWWWRKLELVSVVQDGMGRAGFDCEGGSGDVQAGSDGDHPTAVV